MWHIIQYNNKNLVYFILLSLLFLHALCSECFASFIFFVQLFLLNGVFFSSSLRIKQNKRRFFMLSHNEYCDLTVAKFLFRTCVNLPMCIHILVLNTKFWNKTFSINPSFQTENIKAFFLLCFFLCVFHTKMFFCSSRIKRRLVCYFFSFFFFGEYWTHFIYG